MSAERHNAIYVRVSSKTQDAKSQLPDLERWAKSQDEPVVWYHDKFTGKSMTRPGWSNLEKAIHANQVSRVVVWRLDRLGRTARGLATLFDELPKHGVSLFSVRDGIDLDTACGRLMAHVLASVAQYETEIRAERQAAGIEKARADGKRWGGSKPGRQVTVSDEQIATVQRMHSEGSKIMAMARATGLSRPTIYRLIDQHCGATA